MSNLSDESNNSFEIFGRNGKIFMRTKSGSEINVTNRFKPTPKKSPSPKAPSPKAPSPPKQTKRPRQNITGPGAYFQTNNARKKKAALNVLNSVKSKLTKNEFNHLKNYTNRLLNIVKIKVPGLKSQYKNYTVTRNGKLHAYAITYNRPSNNNTRILELLVSKGGAGKNIINKIKSNARNAKKSKIRIYAVKSAVPFYKGLGFTNKGNVNGLHTLMNYNF